MEALYAEDADATQDNESANSDDWNFTLVHAARQIIGENDYIMCSDTGSECECADDDSEDEHVPPKENGKNSAPNECDQEWLAAFNKYLRVPDTVSDGSEDEYESPFEYLLPFEKVSPKGNRQNSASDTYEDWVSSFDKHYNFDTDESEDESGAEVSSTQEQAEENAAAEEDDEPELEKTISGIEALKLRFRQAVKDGKVITISDDESD